MQPKIQKIVKEAVHVGAKNSAETSELREILEAAQKSQDRIMSKMYSLNASSQKTAAATQKTASSIRHRQ